MVENIREKLNNLRDRNNNFENIVVYSFKVNEHQHINDHEIKRLEHSISSLRQFNKEIAVYLFCDNPHIIPPYFALNYSVRIKPFAEGFDHTMLNAWSIHRWYNLKCFDDEFYNILYVDADTIFYHDVQYLFDTYCTHDVYGREEFGFRHDPNHGGGRNIREQLDLVESCIYDLGGTCEVYKHCLGVILLNDGIHRDITERLDELSKLMEQFKKNQILLPVPNRRIADQYAVWVIFSRMGVTEGLFAAQDVTQGWIEEKHTEHFNPVVCHYTTKKEQEFARSDPKYSNLIRDVDNLGHHIDPHMNASMNSGVYLSQQAVELVAEDNGIVVDSSKDEIFL